MDFLTIHELSVEFDIPARVLRYHFHQLRQEAKLVEGVDYRRDDFVDEQHFNWKINPVSFMRETGLKPVTRTAPLVNEPDNQKPPVVTTTVSQPEKPRIQSPGGVNHPDNHTPDVGSQRGNEMVTTHGSKEPLDENLRLIAGLGFIGQLLKSVSLLDRALHEEILQAAATFLPCHHWALESNTGEIFGWNKNENHNGETCDFEAYLAQGENILLHPGASAMLSQMPSALWRCHLYALTFALNLDLAHAYFQFSEEDDERNLEQFLLQAETESAGCPYRWTEKLRHQSTVLPFGEGTAPAGS